jgi:hypothetical protein
MDTQLASATSSVKEIAARAATVQQSRGTESVRVYRLLLTPPLN